MAFFLKFTLLAAVTFMLGSCPKPARTSMTPPSRATYTYLALGDSYTIGESVEEKDRWSVQLSQQARQKGINLGTPDIIARTGWTTAELAEAIEESGNTQTYDLVSLLIGVNNQYRGQSLDRYRTELRELLQTAIRFARNDPKRVFMLSIPDWGVTPYAEGRDRAKIATEIDAFNLAGAEECRKAGILFIDVTPSSRLATEDASLVASDGLHFSGKLYGQWAQMALPEVEKMLKK